jgi:hypothetical protein
MAKLLTLPLAALALLSLADGTGKAFTPNTRDAAWQLLGVSADGRTLELGYEGGGCLRPDGRPRVAETKHRVTIAVRQTVDVPGAGEACSLELRRYRTSVVLDSSLDGRRVVGGPAFDFDFPVRTVPRVLGMDRRDALKVLRQARLSRKIVSRVRHGKVIRQRPRPGASASDPQGHRVTVRLRLR